MATYNPKPWPKEDEKATENFLKNIVFQTETELDLGIPLKSATFTQYVDKGGPQPDSNSSGPKLKR